MPRAREPVSTSAAQQAVAVARELRPPLAALLKALAGDPPRPVRLTRDLGLDKSLASRLVQAIKAGSEPEFLNLVPSPTGLRMLLGRAADTAAPSRLVARASKAVDAFAGLLDTLPGGRQTLDALLGEDAAAVRGRREHTARQASFKANSFLFGHCCDTLVTSLFLLPSRTAGRIDAIEVHRRIGLQRITPGMTLPLLSVQATHDPASSAGMPRMRGLWGEGSAAEAHCLPGPDGALPEVQTQSDGPMTILTLPPQAAVPPALTTGALMREVLGADVDAAFVVVRNYMLHTPCRVLVREVFLAPGLWPGARPEPAFCLPGPSGTPMVPLEPGRPHLRRVNLSAAIEALSPGRPGLELADAPDHASVLLDATSRAGLDIASFRGWRCRMVYPVPLVEMQFAFTGVATDR